MEENLEIYFCEICNESVPAKDLATREALEVNGKVIGPCCVAAVQRAPSRVVGSQGNSGLTALGVFLIAAVAGATVFLEWRMNERVLALKTAIEDVETNVATQGRTQVADFEKTLEGAARRTDLQPLSDGFSTLEEKLKERVGSIEDRIGKRFDTIHGRLAAVDETQQRIIKGQSDLQKDVKDVELVVTRIERDAASAAAAPRKMARDADVEAPLGGKVEPEPEEPGRKKPLLPANLAQEVARLKAADAGDRFEAVDALILSKNPGVVEPLVSMLKDADAFVRRLTAEGLGSFKDKRSVEGLLVALADPESIVRGTAHSSLKKITGQKINFDPDGSARARSQAQRKWKDWWGGAKATF